MNRRKSGSAIHFLPYAVGDMKKPIARATLVPKYYDEPTFEFIWDAIGGQGESWQIIYHRADPSFFSLEFISNVIESLINDYIKDLEHVFKAAAAKTSGQLSLYNDIIIFLKSLLASGHQNPDNGLVMMDVESIQKGISILLL
jgi:hypothetical protein